VQGRVIVSVRNRVTLPQELLAEIERVAGEGGIDEFIVEAIEHALRQRRQLIAFESAEQETAGTHIPEWDDADRWIREGRRDKRDEWAEESETGERHS
jgi:hypothetical protein